MKTAAMNREIYLVIGCPGSGKTWVCNQLKKEFAYIPHDHFIGRPFEKYLDFIKESTKTQSRPILIETPFGISIIKDPLEKAGFTIIPIFIQEDHNVIASRYGKREGRAIPKGHLTRQDTYAARARELGAFAGTASEVLKYLQKIGFNE